MKHVFYLMHHGWRAGFWQTVNAANGTIQTSDIRLKTNISNADQSKPLP